MKQIINGKTFSTETGTALCDVSSSCSSTEFEWWSETLYQTAKGAYFLHGRGGALSQYSESLIGGARTGGEKLKALTRDEAIEWAERREIDPDELPEDLRPEEA